MNLAKPGEPATASTVTPATAPFSRGQQHSFGPRHEYHQHHSDLLTHTNIHTSTHTQLANTRTHTIGAAPVESILLHARDAGFASWEEGGLPYSDARSTRQGLGHWSAEEEYGEDAPSVEEVRRVYANANANGHSFGNVRLPVAEAKGWEGSGSEWCSGGGRCLIDDGGVGVGIGP